MEDVLRIEKANLLIKRAKIFKQWKEKGGADTPYIDDVRVIEHKIKAIDVVFKILAEHKKANHIQ